MQRFLQVAFVCVAMMLPQHALSDDSATRMKLAEELVAETVTSTMVKNMSDAVWPTLQNSIVSNNSNVSDEALAELKNDFTALQAEQLAGIVVDLPQFYADNFTAGELQDILNFQTSDVGRKMLALQPKLMAEIMPRIISTIQQQMPQIMQKFEQSLQEKGYKI